MKNIIEIIKSKITTVSEGYQKKSATERGNKRKENHNAGTTRKVNF